MTRSYAVSGYYGPAARRDNLHLLTGHRVNEVVFDEKLRASGIRMQQRGIADGTDVVVVKAKKEVIIAAGALHSPQVLQRSGIGPASVLAKANIDLLVDLPGVGGNLQDHPRGLVTFNCECVTSWGN